MKYQRGDICYYDFGRQKSSVQGGIRPCVIVGNNYQNDSSSICVVVPITTARKKQLPTHITLLPTSNEKNKVEGIILCEQLMTVNQSELRSTKLSLDPTILAKMNHALSIELDLAFHHQEDKQDFLEAITYMKDTIVNQRKQLLQFKKIMEEVDQILKDDAKIEHQKILQLIKSVK